MRLGGPHKDEGGHVVWNQGLTRELPDCIQNGRAERLSATRRIGQLALLNSFQTEFQIVRLGIFALAFHHPARNQQKNRAFLQSLRWALRSGVGEKTKRQACGREFGDAGVVTEQSWCVPGVGITESAESLVVATDKCGAGVHARRSFHNAAVEPETEFGHGFGFVDVRWPKEFGSERAKDFLCGRQNLLIGLATPGNIEQAKQNSFRAHSQGVVEVSGDSLPVGGGSNLRAVNLGKFAGHRLQGWWRFGRTGLE